MEDAFIIEGGLPLKGEVKLSGAKNVALKAVVAALLFDGKVVLKNIPKILDIYELLHLIRNLGGKADFSEGNTVVIDATNMKSNRLDFLHASKIRVSFMLFAPLLYRFKKAFIPNPGGCRIGARPIDRIVNGMTDLGVKVGYDSDTGYYSASMPEKPSGSYTFVKPSHTGTELMVLLSVFCRGVVTIHNAAQEPEIDDLINLLNAGGAKIKRVGTDILIEGVDKLKQKAPYTIVSDRNEAITYAVLGIVTRGSVTVSDIPEYYLKTFIELVRDIGGGVEMVRTTAWRFFYDKPLQATDVETDPHPGFMTDWQPNWAVLMTQAQGESIIHEKVFENRFSYVDELVKVGAKIDYFQPEVKDPKMFYLFNFDPTKEHRQAIRIFGPQKLHSGVMKIADLRAGATLAIAALMAEGESVITGASILERGYEDFAGKITALGGKIKKI